MTNFYFTPTPYNMLLSIATAKIIPSDKNILLVSATAKNMRHLAECIVRSESNPINRYVIVNKQHGSGIYIKRIKRLTGSVSSLKTMKEQLGSENKLFVFNDQAGDAQALMYLTKKIYDFDIYYVEDGSVGYNSSSRDISLTGKLARKLLFGPWWRNNPIMYTSGYGSKIYMTFPEFRREEIKDLNAKKLNRDSLLSQTWADKYIREFGYCVDDVKNIDTLLLFPHQSLIKDNEKFGELVESIYSYDENMAVKYHPRDERDYNNNYKTIPRSIPAEIIYIINDGLDFVIGDLSTGLITARWLIEAETISVEPLVSITDQRLKSKMAQMDVSFVQNKEDLYKCLE